jgi:translation initiation factor IF-2
MTEDRDFKNLVRQRAAKTGESYQAARRQLEAGRPAFAARVEAMFRTPAGIAFGCTVEEGHVSRGMRVTVIADGSTHVATVASLRRSKWDVETVAAEESEHRQFGMIVEPPYQGLSPPASPDSP